jgi:TonB family protein
MSAASFSSCLRHLLLLFCTFGLLPALHAQSTEADIKTRLMNKPLYLRGFWRDDKLHFDSTGHLKGNSGRVTFTLSGFDLKKVHLKQDKLILEGRRVGLELAANKEQRVPVNVGNVNNPEDESMHIEITASSTGDYGPALDGIFVDSLAGLVSSLPFYWTGYAQKNFLPAGTAIGSPTVPTTSIAPAPIQQSSLPADIKPHRIGGGVKPPRLLSSTEPDFNDVARRLRYSGAALVNLWVEPDGTVGHLSIVHAIGLGLDERALFAVQQYKFAPATQNGKPVLVELNVEVNFQIF